MSAAVEALRPPSRTLLLLEGRAVPDVDRLGDYLVEAADELKKAVVGS